MIEPTARGAADLTVLAVRAGNLRAGIGASGAGRENTQAPAPAAGAAPERGPAVQVDARTRALAEALAGAEVDAAARPGDGTEVEEAARPGDGAGTPSANRLAVRAQAARAVEAMRKQLAWMEEAIRRFDETGEVWTGDSNGNLVRCEGPRAACVPPDARAYFERLRAGLANYRKSIEIEMQTAASW